jgi:hypothetical protein
MKKIFATLSIAAIFAACTNNPNTTGQASTTTQTDTAGLAEYRQWKTQQELIQTNGMVNGVNEFQSTPNAVAPREREIVYVERPAAPVRRTRTTTRSSGVSSSSGGSGTSTASTGTTQTTRKKGWSKAAKGAVIGGASGAVLGAIVSKKKGLGAVIGGVVGAGAGYMIGRGKDKKDGRY